ncbi:MAG: hypothetical protein AAF170_07645 [Bacteroidota bacterium]
MVPGSISPPTDNLYKFVAIAGVVIALLGVLMFWNSTNKLYKMGFESGEAARLLDELTSGLSLHEQDMRALTTAQEGHLREQEQLAQDIVAGENSAELNQAFRLRQAELSIRSESLRVVSERVMRTRQAYLDEQEEALAMDREASRTVALSAWAVGITGVVGGLLAFLGYSMARRGFRLWYVQVQRYEDAIIRAAAIEAERRI